MKLERARRGVEAVLRLDGRVRSLLPQVVGIERPPEATSETLLKARSDIDKTRIESVVEPIARAHGVELVDVEYAREPGGAVLRILIDRERPAGESGTAVPGSGVTLDDCKAVSRDIGTALDVDEDAVPGSRYRLEVGSPGLDRPLVKPADFTRFAGAHIKVQTSAEVPGAEPERRRFSGILRGFDAGLVKLEDTGPAGTRTLDLPFEVIQKAHLVPQFGPAPRGGGR